MLKSSPEFKAMIVQYLEGEAATDVLFAETLKKPGKNIDNCITYILNTAKNKGFSAYLQTEVYAMAKHYYDEDKIDIGGKISARVVVPGARPELTEDEKALVKQQALDEVVAEEKARLLNKTSKKKTAPVTDVQPSLF